MGQLGGVELLVGLLRQGLDAASACEPDMLHHPMLCLAMEMLALLAAESGVHRDTVRRAGGIPTLVAMLQAPLCLRYRAVLAVRVFTEREVDRQAILLCGGLPKLVALVNQQPSTAASKGARNHLPMPFQCFLPVAGMIWVTLR